MPKVSLSKKNGKANSRIRKQKFLLEIWANIHRRLFNQGGDGLRPAAKNYLQMKTPKVFNFKNLLHYRSGMKEFVNMGSEQLSLLVPKIRIFKVFTKDNVAIEFPISDNSSDIRSILEDSIGRGAGIGLETFSWEDGAKHSGQVGKKFRATLVLTFQTIEEFFKERRVWGRSLSFSNLSVYDLNRVKGKGLPGDKTSGEELEEFKIKIEVGWAVPPSAKGFSPELRAAIRSHVKTFYLFPSENEIEISDVGVATITLHFAAAVDAFLDDSPLANLFYATPEIVQVVDATRQKKIKRLRAMAEIQDVVERTKNVVDYADYFKVRDKDIVASSRVRDFILKNKSDIYELAQASAKAGTDNWLEIVDKIEQQMIKNEIEGLHSKLLDKLKDKRIFLLEADKDLVDQWEESSQDEVTSNQKMLEMFKSTSLTTIDSGQEKTDFRASNIYKELKRAQDGGKSFNLRAGSSSDKNLKVFFMFFGDLLDAAIEIVKDNDPTLEENVGFLLGPAPLRVGGAEYIISLADFPISIDAFLEWFNRVIVKPARTSFSLLNFIRSATEDLLGGVLKEFNLKNQRASVDAVNLPINSEGELSFHIDASTGKVDANSFKQAMSTIVQGDVKQFIAVFFSSSPEMSGRDWGDLLKDAEDGILHLYPGTDKSFVKNITFSRKENQKLRAMRIARAFNNLDSDVDQKVMDVFSVSAETIGNTFANNGSYIFVEPSSLLGSGGAGSAARRFGLVGYFLVTKTRSEIGSSGFSTEFEGLIQSSVRDYRTDSGDIKTVLETEIDPEANIEKAKPPLTKLSSPPD